MSCESIYAKLCIAPPVTLMVGDYAIHQELSALFRETQARIGSKFDRFDDFGRDWRVVGLNKIHIIPHVFSNENNYDYMLDKLNALLPISSKYFIQQNKSAMGRGCTRSSIEAALSAVRKYNLPYREVRSSIEGGNCYVFFDSQDQPKAIVGLHSIAISMLRLEEEGYFEKHYKELKNIVATIGAPSDEAVHRARNIEFFNTFKNGRITEGAYRNLILSPLADRDRRLHYKEALIWEAKERMTRQIIADDLGVPLDNIAFVPQMDFHIDMGMFVGPSGDIVYVDNHSSPENIVIQVQQELTRIGCLVNLVSGVHTVRENSINFMNGIFAQTPSGPLYITNGFVHNVRSKQICKVFKQQVGFNSVFIDAAQKILTKSLGGIHCLTWEKPNFRTPLEIVLSYLDMQIPRKKMRKYLGEEVSVLNTYLVKYELKNRKNKIKGRA